MRQTLKRLRKASMLSVTAPRQFLQIVRNRIKKPVSINRVAQQILRWPWAVSAVFFILYGRHAGRRARLRKPIELNVYTTHAISAVKAALGGSDRKSTLNALLERDNFGAFATEVDERLKPWRESVPYRDLLEDERKRRSLRSRAARHNAASTPIKMLIVSDNWSFSDVLIAEFEASGFEVRSFYFEQFRKKKGSGFSVTQLFVPTEFYSTPQKVRESIETKAPIFYDLIEWADVVFIEWCNLPAIWMSRLLAENKRVIIRLHSYEAFTYFPYFVNWGGVDGLIFVSECVRNIVRAKHGTRTSLTSEITLPNIKRRSASVHSNENSERAFVLGMAGYNNANKNPLLAVEILSHLRRFDPRWKLELIGQAWPNQTSARETQYKDEFQQRMTNADVAGAISIRPFSDDLSSWYSSVGFILSTSDREGTHEVLVEGMSFGAIPIVRRWPMMLPFGGPELVYPDLRHLMFDTAAEAAALINGQAANFVENSIEMKQIYQEKLSPDSVVPKYSEFIQGIVRG